MGVQNFPGSLRTLDPHLGETAALRAPGYTAPGESTSRFRVTIPRFGIQMQITSQRLLDQSQAGVYRGKRHIPPILGLFGPIHVPYPKGFNC